jgi:predicted nucleotidyltransferase
MSLLGDALLTETQQRVLSLLYGQADRSFYTKEILRLTGMGVGTVKRELDRMKSAGILTLTKTGNQHHYQANPGCPIYTELRGIVKKTVGLVDPVARALASLSGNIDLAFIFGSVAGGNESPGSDIDLMVIGDVGFSTIVKALHPLQDELGREINPKTYTRSQWNKKRKEGDAFIRNIMAKPRMAVMGTEDILE